VTMPYDWPLKPMRDPAFDCIVFSDCLR